MILWTHILDLDDLHECANRVNQDFPGCDVYVSERVRLYETTRTRRFDCVSLRSRIGIYHANTGTNGASHEMTASWAEWGWWLARVFEMDPEARANQYRGRESFHEQTNGRFIEPRTARELQLKRWLAVDR